LRSWNKIVVEEDPGVIEVYAGGRMLQGLNVAMCDADVEATRQGYKCINCFENFDNAFPKSCPVCSFPCADRQAEQFAKVYKGHDPSLRNSADWERHADELQERQERRAFERRTGISVAIGKALGR
jgi:hypothetical protein